MLITIIRPQADAIADLAEQTVRSWLCASWPTPLTSEYILLDPAQTNLKHTDLERLVWALVSHPSAQASTLSQVEKPPLMIRRAHLDRLGDALRSLDVLYTRVALLPTIVLTEPLTDVEPLPAQAMLPEQLAGMVPFSSAKTEQPFANPCPKVEGQPRLMMLLPRLEIGGADKFNIDLLKQLRARGWYLIVCTIHEGLNPWHPLFSAVADEIFLLPNFLRPVDYARFLVYLSQSRQLSTVFMGHTLMGYGYLPYWRTACPDTVFVEYIHIEEMYWLNGGHARVSVAYRDLLDHTAVTSQHLKNWLVERGQTPERITVCTINVDTQAWSPSRFDRAQIRTSYDIALEKTVLLWVGRMVPQKRPELLAEIIRRLAHIRSDFVCLVVGDGPMRRHLTTSIRQHNLDKQMRLLGSQIPDDVQRLQAGADIFLLPSLHEGIALALYEAMAMETVPVASDVGGQRELVTSECGYLVPHSEDEIDSYVQILSSLIDEPARRRAMAQACRQRVVNQFDLPQMGTQMDHLLREIVRQPQSIKLPPAYLNEMVTQAIEYKRIVDEYERVADGLRREIRAMKATKGWRLNEWVWEKREQIKRWMGINSKK